MEQKELAIAEIENKKLQEQEEVQKTAERLTAKESEALISPSKEKWQSIPEIPDIASMSKKAFRDHFDRSVQANV